METSHFFGKLNLSALILGAAMLLFSSCNPKSSGAPGGFQPLNDSAKNASLDNLKGVWVSMKYIDVLKTSQSPYDAYQQLPGHAVLVIPGASSADSLFIKTSYKNHSDSSFVLRFQKNSAKGLLLNIPDSAKNAYYTLGYFKSGKDTIASIYHYSGQDVLLDSTLYTKVAIQLPEKQPAGWAIDYIVMKTLFAGDYWIHGQKDPGHVRITDDGKINGLFDFKTYRVRTDFTGAFGDKNWIQLDTIPRENIFKLMVDQDSIKMVSIRSRIMLVKLR